MPHFSKTARSQGASLYFSKKDIKIRLFQLKYFGSNIKYAYTNIFNLVALVEGFFWPFKEISFYKSFDCKIV